MRLITALLLAAFFITFLTPDARGEEIVINAVGDIMLAGRWAPALRKQGYDHPFAGTVSELSQADINLANLESPISGQGVEFTTKKYRFRAEPALAPALRKAGFQVVTLANNHSMDFGAPALLETFQHLNKAGIAWIGAGRTLTEARKTALFTIKGKRVAFLGYSLTEPVEFYAGAQRTGTAPGWDRYYQEDISRARRMADYVIVSFHWGTEGSTTPRAYQRSTAHRAIDAGADVVIGHHPHVLQGLERYKKGLVFYSLGNFAFASTSRTADIGAMVRLKLGDSGSEAEIIPLDVLNARVRFQPQVLSGGRAREVIKRLNELSRPFKTTIQSHDQRYIVEF